MTGTTYVVTASGDGTLPATYAPHGTPGPGDTLVIQSATLAYRTPAIEQLDGLSIQLTGENPVIDFPAIIGGGAAVLGIGTVLTAPALNATIGVTAQLSITGADVIENTPGGTLTIRGRTWYTSTSPSAQQHFASSLINNGNLSVYQGTLAVAFDSVDHIFPYNPTSRPSFPIFLNNGFINVNGGRFTDNAPITGTGAVFVSNGIAELGSSVAATQRIYVSQNATLRLAGPTTVAAAITPSLGATIDLAGIGTENQLRSEQDGSSTLLGGTAGVNLRLAALPSGTAVQLSPNGAGGTTLRIVLPLASGLPAPVDGVVDARDVAPLTLAALVGQGYAPRFAGGPEAYRLTDGTLSVGPDTNEALIERLYAGLLGRLAETNGLAQYDAMLANGSTTADIATIILASTEYAASHAPSATITDAAFVDSLYTTLLNRAAEQGGLAVWTGWLAQGVSRGAVAAAIAQSDEAKSTLAAATGNVWAPDPVAALVDRLYEIGLGRIPDRPGLQSWTSALRAGATPETVAGAIAASPEFQFRHAGQDTTQLVASLYNEGLARRVDAAGQQIWSATLATTGQGGVLLGIAVSPEAAARLSPLL